MAGPAIDFPEFPMSKLALARLDTEAVIASRRRNVEAVASAGQILADGASTLRRRQAEMVLSRLSALRENAEDAAKSRYGIDVDYPARIDGMFHAYNRAVTDVRELLHITVKAQREALDVVGDCVLANFAEMKKLLS